MYAEINTETIIFLIALGFGLYYVGKRNGKRECGM